MWWWNSQYMKGINFVSPPPALYSTLTTNFKHLVWKGKKVNTLSFIYIIEIQKKVNVKLTGTEFWPSMVSGNTRKCLLTEKKYISTQNWRSDGLGMAITTHSISHLVWTVCMARAPHLSSHIKLSLCSRVITPPPWDASCAPFFIPSWHWSQFESTTQTLGLSGTPLWNTALYNRRCSWTSHSFCSATKADQIISGKCPSTAALHRPFIDEPVTAGMNVSSVLTRVSVSTHWELKAPFAPVFWRSRNAHSSAISNTFCYPYESFCKPPLIKQSRKRGFLKLFCRRLYIQKKFFHLVQPHITQSENYYIYTLEALMGLLSSEKSLSGGYSDERKPLFLSLGNHFHINQFHIIIIIFSKFLILAHGGKVKLPWL